MLITAPFEESMNEREAHIALNMMDKVGPVGVRSLAAELGSVSAIFDAPEKDLVRARGVGRDMAKAIAAQRDSVDWQGEIERAERFGARIVTQLDEEYPRPLLKIHDPPLALYVWGRLESRDRHSLAVVGTRRPTHYGRESARSLSFGLAKNGWTVTSGLARGIDTEAHRGALKAKGRTIAVLGGALDCLYPRANAGLAEEIAGQGAVLTEFPFGRQPDKTTFPMRNRIVSGLSMGVLVVEAAPGSGALITATQALEQGRSVMAVPGRIDSPASRGCHGLIKGGARLVAGVDDVLEEYEFLLSPGATAEEGPAKPAPTLTAEEQSVVDALNEGESDVDTLIRQTGLQAGAMSSLLLGLEMKRLVKMLPGRMVELRRS